MVYGEYNFAEYTKSTDTNQTFSFHLAFAGTVLQLSHNGAQYNEPFTATRLSMQAENTHSSASGAARAADCTGKRIFTTSRACAAEQSGAPADELATAQMSTHSFANGITPPARAFAHAHKPLRFLFEQALTLVAPCAAILGIDLPDIAESRNVKPHQVQTGGCDAGTQ